MDRFFIALIVIGDHEMTETELMLSTFTEYFQQLFLETKTGMGQKWLMIIMANEAILDDVKQCIVIRRGKRKK